MGDIKETSVQRQVSLFTQRILDEDTRYNAIIQEHLRNTRNPSTYDLPNYYYGLAGAGAHQFINYRNFAARHRYFYTTIHLEHNVLNLDIIRQAIILKENIIDTTELAEVSASWDNLYLEDWLKFRLQEDYEFDIYSKTLTYQDKYYYYFGDRNLESYANDVDVEIVRIEEYTEQHFLDTWVVIVPYSDTEDKKIYTHNTRILFSDTRGVALEEYITNTSSTEELIPIDTETNDYYNEVIFSQLHTQSPSTETINIKLPPSVPSYKITYRVPSGMKIWVYFPSKKNDEELGQTYYPILDYVPEMQYTEETLPMMMVRGSYFSTDEWEVPIKQIDANDKTLTVFRPSFITEDRHDKTKQILRSLGIDLATLISNIEDNPDIRYISDAFIGFAISPTDTHPATSKALWEFFYEIKERTNPESPTSLLFIDPPFNVNCRYGGLTYTTVEHQVGPVGFITHQITGKPYPDSWVEGNDKFIYQYTDRVERSVASGTGGIYYDEIVIEIYYYERKTYTETDLDGNNSREYTVDEKVIVDTEIIERSTTGRICIRFNPGGHHGETTEEDKEPCVEEHSRTNIEKEIKESFKGVLLTIYKQISPTSCERIQVAALEGTTSIGWSNYGQDTTVLDATSDELLIPLPVFVIEKFSVLEKIDLFERTLRLIIYAEQIQVTEYYRMNPLFQAFIQIIGIVVSILIAVFTYGAGTPLSVAIVAALETIIIGIGIALVIKVLLTVVQDPTIRLVLGIVGAVVGLAAGGFSFDTSSLINLAVLTADTLIKATVDTSLASVQTDMQDLSKEQSAFSEAYEEQAAELDEAWKAINSGLGVEDMVELTLNAESSIQSDTGIVMPLFPSTWYDTAVQTPYRYDLLFSAGYDKVNSFFSDNYLLNY